MIASLERDVGNVAVVLQEVNGIIRSHLLHFNSVVAHNFGSQCTLRCRVVSWLCKHKFLALSQLDHIDHGVEQCKRQGAIESGSYVSHSEFKVAAVLDFLQLCVQRAFSVVVLAASNAQLGIGVDCDGIHPRSLNGCENTCRWHARDVHSGIEQSITHHLASFGHQNTKVFVREVQRLVVGYCELIHIGVLSHVQQLGAVVAG